MAYCVDKRTLLVLILHSILHLSEEVGQVYTIQENQRSLGDVLDTTSVATATHCAKNCLTDPPCIAYNTGPTSGGVVRGLTCETIAHDANGDLTTTQQTGWTRYSRKQ